MPSPNDPSATTAETFTLAMRLQNAVAFSRELHKQVDAALAIANASENEAQKLRVQLADALDGVAELRGQLAARDQMIEELRLLANKGATP